MEHATFEDWWEPYSSVSGRRGATSLASDPRDKVQLRERCREHLPAAPFVLTARAWAARGLVR